MLAGGTLNRARAPARRPLSQPSRTTARSRSERHARGQRLTQDQGSTTVGGGTTLVRPRSTLNGGTLRGSGTVDGSLTNTSRHRRARRLAGNPHDQRALHAGSGRDASDRDRRPDPGTQYDRLAVTGAASLDGTLAIVARASIRAAVGLHDPHGGVRRQRHVRDRHRRDCRRQDLRRRLPAERRDARRRRSRRRRP